MEKKLNASTGRKLTSEESKEKTKDWPIMKAIEEGKVPQDTIGQLAYEHFGGKVTQTALDIYTFDDKKHVHKLNDKALTGVTTILGVIAKPALIQWAANETTKYIKENFESTIYNFEDKWEAFLKEASIAHTKKKESGGEKGKDVHSEIESLIKASIENKPFEYDGNNPQVLHFLIWAMKNKVKFVSSEEHIYSKKLWIGGICDFVCEIDGETWIGDIKTSSAIYPEYFFQTAAYQKCFEEMGKYGKFKGHIILNLKKDGSFTEKRSISNEDNLLAFLAALTLYRTQEKLKGQII